MDFGSLVEGNPGANFQRRVGGLLGFFPKQFLKVRDFPGIVPGKEVPFKEFLVGTTH